MNSENDQIKDEQKSLSLPKLKNCYVISADKVQHPHANVEVESIVEFGCHIVRVLKVRWLMNPHEPDERVKLVNLVAVYTNPISVEIT